MTDPFIILKKIGIELLSRIFEKFLNHSLHLQKTIDIFYLYFQNQKIYLLNNSNYSLSHCLFDYFSILSDFMDSNNVHDPFQISFYQFIYHFNAEIL